MKNLPNFFYIYGVRTPMIIYIDTFSVNAATGYKADKILVYVNSKKLKNYFHF